MGFSLNEMKAVHKRLSNIIAQNAQDLADLEGIFGFIGSIDDEAQQLLESSAACARGRLKPSGSPDVMTAEELKKDCERICAELESKMGRAWLKKHDLQVPQRVLEPRQRRTQVVLRLVGHDC